MKQIILSAALCLLPLSAQAQSLVSDALTKHILPRFEALAENAETLSKTANSACSPESKALQRAYGAAFDTWIAASHLRLGPTEVDDRAFALAFWPDGRGATPKALSQLINDADPIAQTPDAYRDMSIAARGFYALEFLLYDDALMQAGDSAYHCRLIRTISADIAHTSEAILLDWQNGYMDVLLHPRAEGPYQSQEEVVKALFNTLNTGLEFTADTRLGRPLGTFERPRPTRAEVWRSGRSARHVILSLASLRDLAMVLASEYPALAARLDHQFATAIDQVTDLNDPVFASVNVPQSRLKVEILQQTIQGIRSSVTNELGPSLGVTAGFNALDGD